MSQKISDAAFQRGYQLYQNNQVSTIKQNNNLYSANVRDKQYYRVVIMVNDKRKMTKMNCTCIKARKGETCEHEAAVYLKLKSEYHIFDSQEEESFKDYYDSGAYDKAIDFLTSRTNRLMEQLRYDNMKQTFYTLISFIDDYANMQLTSPYIMQIDSIFITTFRKFLHMKDSMNYYLPWLETALKDKQDLPVISLICQINTYLPAKEIIPIYLATLENNIDNELRKNIITYLINHIKELTHEERSFIIKQLPTNTHEYQYMMLYQYIDDNNMEKADELYKQVHQQLQDYDLKDIEIALYKYKGDIASYQKYVLEYYRQSHNLDDLSLLKELKDMYGHQWSSAQFVIIDALLDIFDHIDDQILNELSCYEYQAYRYLSSSSKTIPYAVANYMKNNDFQTYLIIQEKRYVNIIKNAYNYKWICEDIKSEIKLQTTREQFNEFIYDLICYFSNDKLNQELLPLLEGENYGNQ